MSTYPKMTFNLGAAETVTRTHPSGVFDWRDWEIVVSGGGQATISFRTAGHTEYLTQTTLANDKSYISGVNVDSVQVTSVGACTVSLSKYQ